MPDLAEILKRFEESDMKVKCRATEFAVHKMVVCGQSPVLKAAFSGNFKEAATGLIDLSEYEPQLIEAFLQFLYIGEYIIFVSKGTERWPPKSTKRRKGADREEDRGRKAVVVDPDIDSFRMDVEMYSLGDKYDVPSLRTYAKNELTSRFDDEYRVATPELVFSLVPLIYERTPQSDRDLRQSVVVSVRLRSSWSSWTREHRDQFNQLLETVADFRMDMFDNFMSQPNLTTCEYCGPRQEVISTELRCGGCGWLIEEYDWSARDDQESLVASVSESP